MIYRIKIGDQYFDVEINNLNCRPIVASVNGTEIEVWPEDCATQTPGNTENQLRDQKLPRDKQIPTKNETPPISSNKPQGNGTRVVKSPLPGTIHFITIEPGTEVSIGQELLIIESMKMKNAIRANRSGKIAKIFVTVGQSIRHQDPLLEFED